MRYDFVNQPCCNFCHGRSASFLGRRLDRSQGFNPRGKGGISTSIYRCNGCSLISPNPLPIPDSVNDHYEVEPQEYWEPGHFEPEPGYFVHQIKEFRTLYQGNSTAAVLDIGSGTGEKLSALIAAGLNAFGLEPSDSFRRYSIDNTGLSEGCVTSGTVEDAQFGSEQFDWVIFNAVLEHIYDPSSALLKAFTWVKPGGFVYVGVPNSQALLSKLVNFFYWLTASGFVTNTSPMHPPYHLYEFSRQCFDIHGRQHGYSVRRTATYSYEQFLPQPFHTVYQRISEANGTGLQLDLWLQKDPESVQTGTGQ